MSTAPWDQPRNATTITRTQADLDELARIVPGFEIHTQNHAYSKAGEPDRFCCLVSWTNPSYSAQLSMDVLA